jgi:bacteriorhodopsin
MQYPLPKEPPQPKTSHDYTPIENPPNKKSRHGCLTAWLILIIIINVALTVITIVQVTSNPGKYYAWVMPAQIIFCVWSLVCVTALFMWKKWGFYGFFAGAFAVMILYLVTGNYVYVLTPFVSVLCLFGVLNIGGDKRGWPQME